MDIVKIALQEEVDRWLRWHTQKLREMHQYAIDLSNDKNYVDIELTMREYGLMLADEIMITCHKPQTTHQEDIPTPLSISGPSVSISSNTSSHKEDYNPKLPPKDLRLDGGRTKVVTLAHPIQPKETPTKTEFKFE